MYSQECTRTVCAFPARPLPCCVVRPDAMCSTHPRGTYISSEIGQRGRYLRCAIVFALSLCGGRPAYNVSALSASGSRYICTDTHPRAPSPASPASRTRPPRSVLHSERDGSAGTQWHSRNVRNSTKFNWLLKCSLCILAHAISALEKHESDHGALSDYIREVAANRTQYRPACRQFQTRANVAIAEQCRRVSLGPVDALRITWSIIQSREK